MKVRDFMSTPVVVVPAITPVREAARQMDYTGVGSLILVDVDRVVGIVTDRDLALRGIALDLPGDAPVSQAMSPDPVSVAPDDDVDAAIHAFRRHEFRRLPVIDQGLAVGMVTVDDLLLRSYQILGDLLGPVAAEILEPRHPASPLADRPTDDASRGGPTVGEVAVREAQEVRVRCHRGERCDAEVRSHLFRIDQLHDFGGEDTGPTPVEALVAAISASVAQGARRYLRDRSLPATVDVIARFETRGARVTGVELTVTVPDLPEGVRHSFSAVVERCAVLNSLRKPPTVSVQVRTGREVGARR